MASSPTPWTRESVAEAIRPTLDAFALAAVPACRKAADDIYETLLNSVQDYLRENGEWNIGEDIARCRKIEAENRTLLATNAALVKALGAICANGGAATNEMLLEARALLASEKV